MAVVVQRRRPAIGWIAGVVGGLVACDAGEGRMVDSAEAGGLDMRRAVPLFVTLLGVVQGCATYGSLMAADREQGGMMASRQPGPMLPSQDEYPMPDGQCVGRLEADAAGHVTRAIVRCEVQDRVFERHAASQLEALRPVLQVRETGEPARVAWVYYYNTPPEPGKVTF